MKTSAPLAVVIASLVGFAAAHCGTNVLEFAAVDRGSPEFEIEEAKALMDNRDYTTARKLLEESKSDSNDRRTLLVSARLGESGLDIWQILRDLLEGTSASGGIDDFFNVLTSSVFGTGETRVSRIAALRQSLIDLGSAPNPADSKISNVACFVAALWTVPLITDAQTAMSTMQTALASVTPTDCSGLDSVGSALTTLSTLSADFGLILNAVDGCGFVSLSETAATLNSVETQLNRLTTNADNGCSAAPECSPTDIACQALQLTCVHDVLTNDESSVADDGAISTCELVQGCINPSNCFAP